MFLGCQGKWDTLGCSKIPLDVRWQYWTTLPPHVRCHQISLHQQLSHSSERGGGREERRKREGGREEE